jgi:TP901 family phage tail tape measure protein
MADNNLTTFITANADFTSLRTQLAAVTAQLVKLQETTAGTNAKLANQIAVMNKSFASTLTSTGQFSQHFVSLSSDVDKFGKNLDRGRLKLNEYYNAWSGHTKKTSNLIKDLAKQQVMLQQAIVQPVGKNAQGLMQYNVMVAKGLDEIKNKMAIARQEAAIMNKVMLDGSNQLINWGKNTQWAGRQLTVGLTVPLIAFGAAAQKAFREADAELVRLTKVYGGLAATSSADLAQVRKDVSATAKEIASSYGVAYKETIALAADLAATGQQGNDLIQATQQTTRLAVLGEVDRQDAMKATLAIQNAFKQNTEELTQSIDFLNAVENQTSTSLADLTEAIPKAGPVIKALGGDVKDLALYLTAMKEGGVNAAEGANAIKSAMASLINPTKVATEQFAGFGIDLKGIVNDNAGNLTETIMALQSALDQLNPLDKSKAIEQLFGKFQFARMSALFENLGKSGSQTLQVMDLMKASAVDLAQISERELKMMTESASGQFKRAWAAVQADLAATGEQFLKISTKVLKVVDAIINFFKSLPGPVKTFLNALGGITAIAGPLIMMAGVMGNFIGYVVKGIFHLRQLAKGGQGFKLLTPEIIAADAAAKGLATSFYSDSEATIVLKNAVDTLAASFTGLELKANAAKVAVQPAISTVAGSVLAAGGVGQRSVDKSNPLIGAPYSRDMSHLIPAQMPQAGTIFGTVPGAGPVNVRIGKNPQAYMNQDMPKIPGVTSVNGTSTGIVAAEAAKWHAMTAAIAMQSEAEIKLLKTEVMATGTVTSSLSDSYQALLPQFSEITQLAAAETQAIVAELQASKITVDQARAKVIQLNATVEAMLIETTNLTAAGMGRVANLTTVPLTSQPVVDPATGKSNMKEMFHKGTTKTIADRIARALGGVRTSGAGYNIETTKPKFADGGIVPGTGNSDTYHTTAEAGSFVINKKSTEENMPIISSLLGGTPAFAEGGQVPVVLTPGEAVIPADIAQGNMPLMHALNGGPGNTSSIGRKFGGELSENLFTGLKAWLTRNSDPSYDASLKNRIILHDAAVLNHLGFSEDEAVSMAKRDFEEAMERTKDPKTGRVDRKAFNKFRIEQSRRMQEYIDMQGKGRTVVNKDGSTSKAKYKDLLWQDKPEELKPGGRPSANARIQPSRSLVATLMARADIDQVSLQRIMNTFTSNGKLDYASEHLDQDRNFFTEENGNVKSNRTRGNAYLAMAGSSKVNSFTNWLASMTQGKFVDRVPLTGIAAKETADLLAKELKYGNAQNLIKRMPIIQRGHMITQMMRLLLTRGRALPLTTEIAANSGGQIPGKFAQRLFGGGRLFLGMPKTLKQVEAQRAQKTAMERANEAVANSRFSKKKIEEYDDLLEPTSGRSFPVPGIGGVYSKGGDKVFVKPMLDEKAALAEMRATQIAREVHGLNSPKQKIVVMKDPSDPKGKRKILALESKYDEAFAKQDGKFTEDQYFRQLVASALRGDKDLGRGNLSGNILADVGPAGVFATASGLRDYSATMPSFKDQAITNLLGRKGSGAKRFFAESTLDIPKGMTSEQYHLRMIKEIEDALPKLKQTVATFDLNAEEKIIYNSMIKRLSDARNKNYSDLHGMHSSVSVSPEKSMTPAAIAKMIAADELKRRQSGHSASLSDASFKTASNGFAIGGLIGNVLKGKAMHRIGAGFGPTGAPKPSAYESAPWGVNSLSIEMANTLFANTGLRKHTQKLFYDKFAAALAKEKPYGYVKDAQGSLKNALEPDVLDSVIRSAASDMIGDRAVLKQLSPIDKDILRQKYLNWDSKKDTPLTASLKKAIFSLEGREKGGPVNAGQAYVVGEKGPELFVPRNSGGIVPNNKYGVGGMIAPMLAAMAAQILGGKIGGMGGVALSTLGGILPFMAMGAGAGQPKMAPNRSAWIPPAERSPDWNATKQPGFLASRSQIVAKMDLGKQIGPAAKLTKALEGGAAGGGKFASMLGRVALMGTRANVGIALVSTAVLLGIKRWKDHNEHLRIGALQYGLTEEAAKKAGLKYTDYNSKLANIVETTRALREKNQLLYESMQNANTPIRMTVEEYKKLRKEVKSVYSDQVKLINQTKGEKNTKKLAEDLKIQLMAAGLSAEDATKKIWAMFKMSDKALTASDYTLKNSKFNNIQTKQDAAAQAVGRYGKAAAEGGVEGAGAVNTGLTAIDSGIQDLIDKSKKANKKDKSVPILTEYEAQEKMMKRLNNLESSKVKLTAATREEMIKQNPALAKVLNPADTLVSLFEKMNLASKGFTGNLANLGSEAVSTLSKIADVASAAIATQNEKGLLKAQYKELGRLEGQYKSLQKAAKGQSVAQQISTRDQLKSLQKQIDANNKLADSRLKALDAAKQEGDIANEIAKKKVEYDSAIARGDTATAQQAGLDVKQLESTMQYNSQKKSIEDSRDRINAKIQEKIDAINNAQEKLGDKAALAGEGLSKLADKIATQRQKIEDFNKAMVTLVLNAIAAGKTVEQYIKDSKAGQGDAAALLTNGKAVGAFKGDVKGVDVAAETLKLMGKPMDAVTSALSSKGITMGSGDIIINGKKADVSASVDANGKPLKTISFAISEKSKTVGTGNLNAAGIETGQIRKGLEFLDKDGKKWKLTGGSYYNNWDVVKAGYGTNKLDPKKPTIVGDRGPELAFGGMVIPNMAKIPFASPRYDVNQAAKMFEPIQQSNTAGVINLTQNIYPSEGMNTDAFVRQVVSMTKQAIGQDAKLNAKMVGNPMNVSIKT